MGEWHSNFLLTAGRVRIQSTGGQNQSIDNAGNLVSTFTTVCEKNSVSGRAVHGVCCILEFISEFYLLHKVEKKLPRRLICHEGGSDSLGVGKTY
jgi:hypothetical protein